jgi:hypothetical protein
MLIRKIFFILYFIFNVLVFLFAEVDNNKAYKLNDDTKSKILNIENKDNYVKFTIKYSDLFDGENFGKK